MKFFYYFAYGSNLLKDRIRYRQKGAEYVCNGSLKEFTLEFVDFSRRWQGALATINRRPETEVWGCVWKIPDEYSASLDEQEASYNRLTVLIDTEQGPIYCRTYQFADLTCPCKKPSPQYKAVIVSGAKEHALPAEYIKKLEAFEDNGYDGKVEVKIPILKQWNEQSTEDTNTTLTRG